jgi:hypothetical protein
VACASFRFPFIQVAITAHAIIFKLFNDYFINFFFMIFKPAFGVVYELFYFVYPYSYLGGMDILSTGGSTRNRNVTHISEWNGLANRV